MTKVDQPPQTKEEIREERDKHLKILQDATEALNRMSEKRDRVMKNKNEEAKEPEQKPDPVPEKKKAVKTQPDKVYKDRKEYERDKALRLEMKAQNLTDAMLKKLEENEKKQEEQEGKETDEQREIRIRKEIQDTPTAEDKDKDTNNIESSKYPFVWTKEKSDGELEYEYEEGEYTFEINGKKVEIVVREYKTEWKVPKLKKIVTLGLSRAEKEVFTKEPTWITWTRTENKELSAQYNGGRRFKTKQEAMAFAEKIIDDGMEIKFEEEKKYMGITEPTQEPPVEPTQEPSPVSPEPQQPLPINEPENQTAKEKKGAISKFFSKIGGWFSRKNKEGGEPTQIEPENGMLTPEKIADIDAFLGGLEKGRLSMLENGPKSLRIKNGAMKGIKAWEKFGVEQKDKDGNIIKEGVLWKRMTKMLVNLSLIGVISVGSIDQFSKHTSAITATALGGSATTALGKKLAIGLGFGAFMELGGKKIPPKIKKWIPAAMGIASVGTISILSGGIALAPAAVTGLSVGLGYLSSKYIPNIYTDDKLASKKKEATEKLLNKYRGEDGTIDQKYIPAIEKDYAKLLKHFENLTIRGKLANEGVKILAGSFVSAAALELSGLAQDHQIRTELREELKEMEAKHLDSVKHLDKMDAKHEADVKYVDEINKRLAERQEQIDQQEAEAKADTTNQDQTTKPEANQTTEPTGTTPGTTTEQPTGQGSIQEFMKADSTDEAIKLGMYTPGSENESMIVQSGTITFDDGHGHIVPVPYSSHGAIQTMDDLKQALHAKFGDNIPEGKLTTHYTDMKGVEHDQTFIHTENNVSVTEKYHGDMFDSDKNHQVNADSANPHDNHGAEQTHTENHPSEYNAREQATGESAGAHTNLVTNNEQGLQNHQVDPVTGKEMMDNNHNVGGEGKESTQGGSENDKVEGADNTRHDELPPEQLAHVREVFDNNIEYLKGDIDDDVWNHAYKDIPAENLMEMYDNGELTNTLKPLESVVYHIQRLEQVTGFHPYGVDLLNGHTEPESIPHFIDRALEEAQLRGLIDEVTL